MQGAHSALSSHFYNSFEIRIAPAKSGSGRSWQRVQL